MTHFQEPLDLSKIDLNVTGLTRSQDRKWLMASGLNRFEWPRHYPVLQLIKEAHPEFHWEESFPDNEIEHGKQLRFFNYPTIKGVRHTFATLARMILKAKLNGENVIFDNIPAELAMKMKPILELGAIGSSFTATADHLGCMLPDQLIANSVADWLRRARGGVESHIVMNVCPDYAHENGKYTFGGLGEGVGLVAQRAIDTLPALHKFIYDNQLNINLVIGMADTEAENPANLKAVNLSREEFIEKAEKSLRAIKAAVPANIPVKYIMLGRDLPRWKFHLDKALTEIDQNRWSGVYPFSEKDLNKVISSRAGIYSRWYGKDIDPRLILAMQAAEYMAICVATEEVFPNVLYLGVDSPWMSVFKQGLSDKVRPVLYLKQPEY